MSKTVLLATCGTALVLLVSLGPQAWAAPWHNPRRQTVPTITPDRGGDEDDGDGEDGGDETQPTAGPEVVPSPTGTSAWPSPTTTVSSSTATSVSPDSARTVAPPDLSPVPSSPTVTTVPPTPTPAPISPSPPPSDTRVPPSPTPLVTVVPSPVPAATHSALLLLALSGLAATNAGRVLIVGIMLILVGGALLLGRS